ncbi:MAG: ATP-binding protein [Candidatus Acididesulfobacter diazotrophicus]|uniref:ATP-binding protein n=1 Tax=Candidatus Acididesulfobacter diazotrophicus TaxID=2597226 RepID=A0A519BK26_9DELT|nr:MAG: ATP-binding protein [Candidatus Acididesulfobacter diazotrophicus]
MIKRIIGDVLKNLANQYPVVTITGPRQSGKTTLIKNVFADKQYVNLESPDIRQFAVNDPKGFLAQYNNAILDEIQRAPELLSYIQPIVDKNKEQGQFIITGSQQFEVLNNISQSLAGRTALLKLLPFSISEIKNIVDVSLTDKLIYTGFYPRIYDMNLDPHQAIGDYIVTYVERDIRQLISIKDLNLFEKFLKLCAGRIGQLLNFQGLANDVGVSHTTVRSWVSILEASYIIFLLPPWYNNFSKRLVKSPKLYFYDVGLASYLLGIENEKQVFRDPLRGNLFENLVVAEVLKYRFNKGKKSNLYFYRDSTGLEIDLIYEAGRNVYPIEIKSGATISEDFFKNLKKFIKFDGLDIPYGGAILYGGNEIQERTDFKIYPVSKTTELLNSIP